MQEMPSPSFTSSPCTSPEFPLDNDYQTLPSSCVLEGPNILLAPLDSPHKDHLWRQLREEENVALFKESYGTSCPTGDQFWDIIASSNPDDDDEDWLQDRNSRLTLTVLDKKKRTPIGWIVLQSSPGSGSVHAALFLSRICRLERGTEVLFCLARLLFNELKFQSFAYRTGKLNDSRSPGGESMGYTLIGVLSRQHRIESRSKECDSFIVTRRQWPHVYAAVKAWLSLK